MENAHVNFTPLKPYEIPVPEPEYKDPKDQQDIRIPNYSYKDFVMTGIPPTVNKSDI